MIIKIMDESIDTSEETYKYLIKWYNDRRRTRRD